MLPLSLQMFELGTVAVYQTTLHSVPTVRSVNRVEWFKESWA
jgi:hypothetical protein